MNRTTRDTLVASLAGVGIGAGLYWLGGYVVLALATGLCWACGLRLTLYIGHLYPEYATGEAWADKRWSGLGGGAMSLAALVGVSPLLPISSELRIGLGGLVVGTGLVLYAAGSLAVLERVENRSNSTSPTTAPSHPTDD